MDLTLPYISLQPDYLQAYTDVSQSLHDFEKVWLSIYCLNAPKASIHTKLLLSSQRGNEVDVSLDDDGRGLLNISSAADSKADLKIASTSSSSSHAAKEVQNSIKVPATIIRIPKKTIGPVVKGSLGVTAFDISPDQRGRYVVGGADGQAHVGDLGTGIEAESMEYDDDEASFGDIERLARQRMRKREREQEKNNKTYLKGHVGDLRSAKFFPSGQVLLTTSSDCTARIWGLDGSNPRTLTGHRRGVTSSYMIGKGREILTSSSDGTTRLWDVGEGVQKRTFTSHKFSSINVVSMGARDQNSGQDSIELDDTSAQEKLLFTGLSNGFIEGHDLSSGASVFKLPKIHFPSGSGPSSTDYWEQISSSSIQALEWSRTTNILLAGCSNGVTMVHDVRMLSCEGDDASMNEGHSRSLVSTWRRNGAAINDIRLIPNRKEAILATADGTPYRISLEGEEGLPRVLEEYNGWDVDNVQSSSLDGRGRVWLAGADGFIRMY